MMKKNTTQGYTLLEMLVAIFIISIVVPIIFISISNLYETHGQTISQAFALIETTKGVKEIVRDVRSAVYSEEGSLPLVTIATSTITLFTDTDYDGRVERVRYFLSNGVIKKGIIEPTATSSYPTNTETVTDLVLNVVNTTTNTPLFRYYTATSTEVVSASSILLVRRVEVHIIGSSRFGSERSEVALRSSASIRNLKESF